MASGLPNLSDRGGEAARLLAAAGQRGASARRQLSLPDDQRLDEWELHAVRELLTGLVETVERGLRAAIAERLGDHEGAQAALSSANVPIAVPILTKAELWRDRGLLSHILWRVAERRLQPGARTLVPELARDRERRIASAAMALLVAESGRLGPDLTRTDLPAELQHRLVWAVAAALRHYLIALQGVPAEMADPLLSAAAGTALGSYEEERSYEGRCLRLARRLARAERLNDELVERALTEAGLTFFAAALAVRANLPIAAAQELLSGPPGEGATPLLRAAGIERPHAAAILLHLQGAAGERALDRYDGAALTPLSLWRADPAYRAALARIVSRAAA
jgi:hypothetical protein